MSSGAPSGTSSRPYASGRPRRATSWGLEPLADLFERHHPLLGAVEDSRPPDAPNNQWQTALRGLRAFLAAGHADVAERLGWPPGELYAVPPVWARVDLCGAALLIGDHAVIEVTADAIRVKTASGATQRFFRRPHSVNIPPNKKSPEPTTIAQTRLAGKDMTAADGEPIADRESDSDHLDAIVEDKAEISTKLSEEQRQIRRWINANFSASSPDLCRYCGCGPRIGDAWVWLYCGADSGVVHQSCRPAWERAAERAARLALRLDP